MSGPCRIRYKLQHKNIRSVALCVREMKCWSQAEGARAIRKHKLTEAYPTFEIVEFIPAKKFEFAICSVRKDGDGEPVERRQRFTSRRAAKRWIKWANARNEGHTYSLKQKDKSLEKLSTIEAPRTPQLDAPRMPWTPKKQIVTDASHDGPAPFHGPAPTLPPGPIEEPAPKSEPIYERPEIDIGDSVVIRLPVHSVEDSGVTARVGNTLLAIRNDEIIDVIKRPFQYGDAVYEIGHVGYVYEFILAIDDEWAIIKRGTEKPRISEIKSIRRARELN